MYLSADDFLAGITGEAVDFELPGVGTIQVRSLTTAEVMRMRTVTQDEVMLSVLTVQYGLVAPKLDTAGVARLQEAKPGVIQKIARHIMELSDMLEDAEKKVGTGSSDPTPTAPPT